MYGYSAAVGANGAFTFNLVEGNAPLLRYGAYLVSARYINSTRNSTFMWEPAQTSTKTTILVNTTGVSPSGQGAGGIGAVIYLVIAMLVVAIVATVLIRRRQAIKF
jgi:hypothetical protein